MRKTATHSHKESFDPAPAGCIAGAVDISGATGPDNDRDLAQLVWKYFGEEISETLMEVQEAFAPDKCRSNNT